MSKQHSELVGIVGDALAQSCEGYFTQRQDAEAAFESLVEQLQSAQRKVDAYDRARSNVKITSNTRAEYALRIDALQEQLEADHAAWEDMRAYNARLEEEVKHWKYDHQEASKALVARAERAEEQLEAMREALDWIEAEPEDPAKVQARARAVLYPASRPLDMRFPNHVEGCICPRFKDIAPDLIADLTCPVHGVNGTDPGDVISERSPASEPEAS